MQAPRTESNAWPDDQRVDWEAFYRDYRKPGYVPGFEIVHKLGGGMFGLVFKARKESIGKDYAIKFLKVDDEMVRDAVARELETVRFFAQIDHPNLVSIEDRGIVDGIPYLVMSYAGQDTLQQRLREGGLGREKALEFFVQAARGVQALHEHSLVHFDLKPANIFLKGDVARVGDYGLSKLVSESRNSLSFSRGTPYYMAPEMLQRRGDARSDIYSLGIILFECLYGDVPFRGDSEWEVLRKHETAAPEFPATSLPGDRDVLRRCLAKDPEARFASVAELLRALDAPTALGTSLVFRSPAGPAPSQNTPPRAGAASPPLPLAPPSMTPPPLPASPPQRAAPARSRGPIGLVVTGVVSIVHGLARLVLQVGRMVGVVLARVLRFLFRLPVILLRAASDLVGVLVVAGIVVLVVVTLLKLVSLG